MPWLLDTSIRFIGEHVWLTGAGLIGMLSAAVAAYARGQIYLGTNWLFAPFTRSLPWNGAGETEAPLRSKLTFVEVRLVDDAGRIAQYRKLSGLVVQVNGLQTYKEGVTAEGRIGAAYSMRGIVKSVHTEHGFALATIELEELAFEGSQLTNVFETTLYDCFLGAAEHWTQEVVYPTERLTIVVIFPKGRPPRAVRSSLIAGHTPDQRVPVATVEHLFGTPSVVWEVQNPSVGDIYKIEWQW